jgi:hypothetical protein
MGSLVSDDRQDHGHFPLTSKVATRYGSHPPSTGLLHLKSSHFCVKIR